MNRFLTLITLFYIFQLFTILIVFRAFKKAIFKAIFAAILILSIYLMGFIYLISSMFTISVGLVLYISIIFYNLTFLYFVLIMISQTSVRVGVMINIQRGNSVVSSVDSIEVGDDIMNRFRKLLESNVIKQDGELYKINWMSIPYIWYFATTAVRKLAKYED